MNYRETRNAYLNLEKRMFPGEGKYNIPVIRPVYEIGDDEIWIGFNYVRGCEEPERHSVHFFVDDYQFDRVWKDPDRYVSVLHKFKNVCTPDFSLYSDFPIVPQLFNHYRKHWLGAYWQERGIRVIPTVGWSDPSSYEWCFDGEPHNSIVALSSVGTQKHSDTNRLFMQGYQEMLKRLTPKTIIFQGKVPEECRVNGVKIIEVKAFQEKWRGE